MGTLLFYWYFSKSIVAAPGLDSEMSEGYFVYILVGELSLLWPGVLLANPSRVVKQLYYKRALENLIVLKGKAAGLLVKMSLTQVILQSLKYIIYLIALLFFSQQINVLYLVSFFIIQLIYVPLFLSLSLLAACIVVMYGRGEKIIQLFVSASYVLAGVYFPTDVFPHSFAVLVDFISPFNALLHGVRQMTASHYNVSIFLRDLGPTLLRGLVLFLVGYAIMEHSFKRVNRRKKPLLI